MTDDTRIALFLMGGACSCPTRQCPLPLQSLAVWGHRRPWRASVEELLLDWLDPFLTEEEQDRLIVWHLG